LSSQDAGHGPADDSAGRPAAAGAAGAGEARATHDRPGPQPLGTCCLSG
jgi:hypothetical protein